MVTPEMPAILPKLEVLIQDRTSRLYLAGPDKWTSNRSEAVDFKVLESAREFVHREPMPNARIVPRFTRAAVRQKV